MVHRHAVAGRRTALVAVGTLMLGGIASTATAGAEPPPLAGPLPSAAQTLGADRPSAEVLHALGRDLGLTGQQAATRLVNEAEAGTRAGRLRLALGERFAGAWLSGATSGTLTVATTSDTDVTTIQGQGAKAAVVDASLAELTAVKGRLDRAASRFSTRNAPQWFVDVPRNKVVIEATSTSAATAFARAAGLDAGQVDMKVSSHRPHLMADITGGDAYYINGTARCSVGFSVTRGAEQGFASAGHCGDPGARTTGYDQTEQGTFRASSFPGEDMAWVSVNDDWTATAGVKGEEGENVQIGGSVEALVGASVCRSGSTTGWHCGTIQQHGTSVSYAEGVVDGLTRTTVCAEPGDSGGPYVSGAQAQGLTSGGTGDCTRGGTTFYQPVNPVLGDYGLTLKTASTGVANPGQQEGDPTDGWAAGRVYHPGATVTIDGVRYQCLQAHQAQGSWTPAATPALWQRV